MLLERSFKSPLRDVGGLTVTQRLRLIPALIFACCGGTALAEETSKPGELNGKVAELAALLGTWEVTGEWSFGQKLWARALYAPGPGGNTLTGRVLVKDGDGVPYVRYASTFAYDKAEDQWMAHTVNHDGAVGSGAFTFADNVMVSEWTDGGNTIRDTTTLADDGRMQWLVQMAPEGTEDYQTLLEATWTRPAADTRIEPIDSNLFHPAPRESFVVTQSIAAPVSEVFAAWTDPAKFRPAFAPDWESLTANIDLVVGGRYELLWDGITGSNDCQILSYIPDRMVSFSWNAPPEQKDSRAQRTWVVVEFEPAGEDKTDVRLTHLGFGSEPHWQETKAYFESAWPMVMGRFAENLGGKG